MSGIKSGGEWLDDKDDAKLERGQTGQKRLTALDPQSSSEAGSLNAHEIFAADSRLALDLFEQNSQPTKRVEINDSSRLERALQNAAAKNDGSTTRPTLKSLIERSQASASQEQTPVKPPPPEMRLLSQQIAQSERAFNSDVQADNAWKAAVRTAGVLGQGATEYAIGGFYHAVANDWHHPDEMFAKVTGGAIVGSLMKAALPQKGVVRGIAATVMIGFMAYDLYQPFKEAVATAWNSTDENALDAASKKFGDGLGSFAWDSGLGMVGGKLGEVGTGWAIKKQFGAQKYIAFETAKENFFEKRGGVLGALVEPSKETFNKFTAGAKRLLAPEVREIPLTEEETRERVREALNHVMREKRELLYKTPEFSRYMDGLMGIAPKVPRPETHIPSLTDGNRRALAAARRWDDMAKEPPDEGGTPNNDTVSKPPVIPIDKETAKGGKGDTFPKPKGPDISPAPAHEGESSPIDDQAKQPKAPPTDKDKPAQSTTDKVPPTTDPADGEVTVKIETKKPPATLNEGADGKTTPAAKPEGDGQPTLPAPKDAGNQPTTGTPPDAKDGTNGNSPNAKVPPDAKDGSQTPEKVPAPSKDGSSQQPGQPTDSTAKPTDTTAKPTDTTAKPTDTTAKPTDTTAKPTDTTAKPTDTTAKPTDTTAKPTDAQETVEKPKPAKILTAEEEFSPKVLEAVANEARARQEKWTQPKEEEQKGLPSQAALADFRDMTRGPILDVSDSTRKGALLPQEFEKSARDLSKIISEEIQNFKGFQEAGPLVEWHALAANQILLHDKNALSLNMLADEIYGSLLFEMRRLGVVDNLLEGTEPSLVAIGDDRGSGNFTIPRIEDILRRAITLFPRNQSELVSVLAAINYHENRGHDHIFPLIALITKLNPREGPEKVMNDEYRLKVIGAAVQEAFQKSNIADSEMQIGDKKMKKSELMTQLLIAEANENTADMAGTAASIMGTPLSLGVLLQSLRPRGVLETRNVYGSEFGPDMFEPHGLDRWRIKLSAQVLRHLSEGDKLIHEHADALDSYAAKASRPGSDYVFASTDQPGQTITLKQNEWDAVIPFIVKTQFDTPLPALTTKDGMKTLTDLVPNFVEVFHKQNELANQIVEAIESKSTRLKNFDKEAFRNEYTIGNVFNANLMAWVRATARGEDPKTSLDTINGLFDNIRDIYIEHNPHQVPLTPTVMQKFTAQPVKFVATSIARGTGIALDSPGWRTFLPHSGTLVGGTFGAVYGGHAVASGAEYGRQEIVDMWKRTQEILKQ